ncbi:MAG: FkbM family methyltransferase [Flavobacterium sp.]|nr:FkbM family methyltransferase [Flavobacterium sp.]
MQGKLAKNWLNFIRLYTFYSPLRKGKYRLFEFALRQTDELPNEQIVTSTDGRKFKVDLKSGVFDTVFFLGEYERDVTNVIEKVVRQDDVCLDIGANFGWFTTLFHKLGASQIHSFEPVPSIFELLNTNINLQNNTKNIFPNNLALGDKFDKVELHLFDNLPIGHASISTQGKENFQSFEAKMVPLNSYLSEKNLEVNFVKMDIEGAELMCLQGGTNLFKQKTPPMFVIEMALETSKNFGYTPNDLIEFINSQTPYDFYALNQIDLSLKKIEGFKAEEIGANVLCVPKNCYQDRLKFLRIE